jgi:hypothetical protein
MDKLTRNNLRGANDVLFSSVMVVVLAAMAATALPLVRFSDCRLVAAIREDQCRPTIERHDLS